MLASSATTMYIIVGASGIGQMCIAVLASWLLLRRVDRTAAVEDGIAAVRQLTLTVVGMGLTLLCIAVVAAGMGWTSTATMIAMISTNLVYVIFLLITCRDIDDRLDTIWDSSKAPAGE